MEKEVLDTCGTIPERVLHDFDNFCPHRADAMALMTKRRQALGQVVEEDKLTFNTEVMAKLLECGSKLE